MSLAARRAGTRYGAQLIRLSGRSRGWVFCAQNAVGLLLTCTTSPRCAPSRSARTTALKAILADEERVASIRESLSAACSGWKNR